MNSYTIPREIGDENRFLFFSTKSLIFFLIGVCVGGVISLPFFLLVSVISWMNYVAWGIILIFGGIGYCLGTFKIPDSNAFDILKKTGGESVDTIVKRVLKFRKNRKIYIYKGGNDTHESRFI